MQVFIDYLLQNWALILVLIAFVIMLRITVFLDKKTIRRMYVLIALVFALSIIVFAEFYLEEIRQHNEVRIVLMAIRYSATPFIIAFILFTLVKKARWYVFLPAIALTILNVISIFTGIVFDLNANGDLLRGALGYLPYIGVGLYSAVLVYVLVKQSNKQTTEIIPIIFLAFAFASGIVFPLIIGKNYSRIFCTTIAVALFVYYVFLILQLTKKDALTGLFNRQAYYSSIHHKEKDITAVISIDMNGLKAINDNQGHIAGDKALTALADAFQKAVKSKQHIYRLGGDEFVIICWKTSKEELKELIKNIKDNVSKTIYTCSIGYCYNDNEDKDYEAMVHISDEMMYADKDRYYQETGIDRRSK